jgi:uncharacterized protein YeaO (DUF488 family)
MKKSALVADAWMKQVAPSTKLRQWFDHRVERWEEFRRRYRQELDANPSAWAPLVEADGRGTVTLLYSAHDVLHNGAVVLLDYLSERRTGHPHRVQRGGHRLTPPRRATARKSSASGRSHGSARRRAR